MKIRKIAIYLYEMGFLTNYPIYILSVKQICLAEGVKLKKHSNVEFWCHENYDFSFYGLKFFVTDTLTMPLSKVLQPGVLWLPEHYFLPIYLFIEQFQFCIDRFRWIAKVLDFLALYNVMNSRFIFPNLHSLQDSVPGDFVHSRNF